MRVAGRVKRWGVWKENEEVCGCEMVGAVVGGRESEEAGCVP